MTENMGSFKKITAKIGLGQVFTAFGGVIVLMVIFTCMNQNFASAHNLTSLLRQICPYLLVGIGQAFVCITGNIDLSIGSVIGMSSMISATLMCNGFHPVVAVLAAFVACMAIGVMNGILVGMFKLPPFIGTLGTMTIGRGIAQIVNGNYNTGDIGQGAAEIFRNIFYYGKTLGIYNGVWITLIVWIVFNYILGSTKSGRHTYAIGSNVDAARLSGVNVFQTVTKAYLASSFCSFLTGLIILAAAGMGSMDAGMTYEMYAVAAAVIGGVSTLGGSGLLVGVIAGAGVWAVLQNGLTFANAPVAIRNIVIGVIVVVCVLMDIIRSSGSLNFKFKKAA